VGFQFTKKTSKKITQIEKNIPLNGLKKRPYLT